MLTIQDVTLLVVLVFAFTAMVFLILVTMKTMRAPSLYYAPSQTIDELADQLVCPKCRLRKLEPSGYYTIRCGHCGFTFNVGTLRLRGRRR